MEPFELDSMMVIQAQRQRLIALIDENVQLTAAVNQLQAQLERIHTEQHELEMARNGEVSVSDDPTASITDITDQVAGAEITT